jgi:cytochrome c-type biogenesis protein CcmH
VKRKLAVISLLAAFLLHGLAAPALALKVGDVAGEFICNCGCNKNLAHCDMPCGEELRGFIKDQIRKGLGKEQIVQYMKVNFSQALLAAPEKKGFNLTAWITPFAVVFAGGVLMLKVLSAWASKRHGGEDDDDNNDAPTKPSVDKEYNDRIEAELKEFGW